MEERAAQELTPEARQEVAEVATAAKVAVDKVEETKREVTEVAVDAAVAKVEETRARGR